MTYIINPMWFYFIDVISALKFIVTVVGALCAIAAAFFSWCKIDPIKEEEQKELNKIIKPFVIISIAALIVWAFLPSKETMITMMVAKFATYENTAWTLDTVKAAVDYIVNAIASIG